MGCMPYFRRGIRWRIGSGSDVRVWGEFWLPRHGGLTIRTPLVDSWTDLRVDHFIDRNTMCWRRERLEEVLWHEDVEDIVQIPLPCTRKKDVIIWHFTNNGRFSVRSAYHLIRDIIKEEKGRSVATSSNVQEERNWLLVWKLNLPNNIKLFLWRLLREALPSRSNLVKRGLKTTEECPLCNEHVKPIYISLHAVYKSFKR
ncbi:hypothetical protein OROHE_002199 [Orobanche hederae]